MSQYPKIAMPFEKITEKTEKEKEKEKEKTAKILSKFKAAAENKRLITKAFKKLNSKKLEPMISNAIGNEHFLKIRFREVDYEKENERQELAVFTKQQVRENEAFQTFEKKVNNIGYKTKIETGIGQVSAKESIGLTFSSME